MLHSVISHDITLLHHITLACAILVCWDSPSGLPPMRRTPGSFTLRTANFSVHKGVSMLVVVASRVKFSLGSPYFFGESHPSNMGA